MAHLSGDKGLMNAFAAERDIHQATAAEVFELDPDDVTADQRRSAKAINFGLMYGMSAFGLAKQLGTTRGEAQEYVDLYFERYPGVKTYMDGIRAQAHDSGFVETVFGRRLPSRCTEVFELDPDDVTADQRRSAKAINFGLMYGMSAFGLAKQLGTTRGEAQEYVDLYFERYPGVKTYMDGIRAQAHDSGFVETVFGRRLYLPEINDRNAQRRQYAERSAINAPMQGTAADIIKKAMISVHKWIQDSGAPARMIMQVHDELVFEVSKDSTGPVGDEIITRMSAAAELAVPLKVDVGIGANWDEAH